VTQRNHEETERFTSQTRPVPLVALEHWRVAVAMCASLILSGCLTVKSTAPGSGLQPVYPRILVGHRVVGPGPAGTTPNVLLYERTDSWQPALKWESFPGAVDRDLDSEHSLARITHTRYDLRIWREENGWPVELAYEREGLPAPEHRVEKPLAPGMTYCWSIRARFEVDGQTRVSRWGFVQFPFTGWYGISSRALAAGRVDQIPGPNYYRFQTPEL